MEDDERGLLMDTFNPEWMPLIGCTKTHKFRVRSVQFGDGYRQTAGDGPNPKASEYQLQWVVDGTTAQSIKSFLDSQEGWRKFIFTPPGNGELSQYVTCEGYEAVEDGEGWEKISATFVSSVTP